MDNQKSKANPDKGRVKNQKLMFIACVILFLASCIVEGTYTGEITPPPPPQSEMILTKQGSGEKTISLAGTGEVSINWGDGSSVEKQTLSALPREFKHTFSGASATRNIKITGENITILICRRCQLISLDVSKNIKLEKIDCSFNNLKLLDLEKNNVLKDLSCNNNDLESLKINNNNKALFSIDISSNKFNATVLNTIFGMLHKEVISGGKTIYISNNPGTATSDENIAKENGWEVNKQRIWDW